MSSPDMARLPAPVDYSEVRVQLNTMRAVFGVALGLFALPGLAEGLETAPWVLALAAILTADASWRRRHGTSAIPVLVIDILIFNAVALLEGNPELIQSTAALYILTGALLLLRIPVATFVIAFCVVVALPAGFISPIFGDLLTPARETALNTLIVISIAAIMATLLYGAVRALHGATQRHEIALAAERRAVQLKDEFVSMVSHEFRTPLTSIAGFSETLRANWSDLEPEEISEFLIIMRQEAQHLSNLVEDILVIPRIEAGRLRLRYEEFDLAGEVAATARLVFADTGRQVNINIPGGVIVNADRGRSGQVLRNLLDNARKYGGEDVQVDGDAGVDTYTVTVSDNGPGVAEPYWERVFDHFEQVTKGDSRESEGVGLGLPIARRLARAMGGDVWYVPRFPTGASFSFSMQLSRIIPTGSPQQAAEKRTPESDHPAQLPVDGNPDAEVVYDEPSSG